MSLVDPYHDRVFRNGRVYGVNYDEQTMRPTYTDVSPFGGRMAGTGIGLEPDVVVYMGRAAQGMPQDEDMDQRIAYGFMKAIDQFFKPRTMEYREERNGPLDIQPIPRYEPGSDQGLIQLAGFDMPADMSYPHIPGRRLEGVPNANDPVMREKLRNRRLRNPAGGEDLPGFLGKV